MGKIQGFLLYRIWYGDTLAYLGRTKQPLQTRIHGHLFKKPMHRSIAINLVTKIEVIDKTYEMQKQEKAAKRELDSFMRKKWHAGELTDEEYEDYLHHSSKEEHVNDLSIDDIWDL